MSGRAEEVKRGQLSDSAERGDPSSPRLEAWHAPGRTKALAHTNLSRSQRRLLRAQQTARHFLLVQARATGNQARDLPCDFDNSRAPRASAAAAVSESHRPQARRALELRIFARKAAGSGKRGRPACLLHGTFASLENTRALREGGQMGLRGRALAVLALLAQPRAAAVPLTGNCTLGSTAPTCVGTSSYQLGARIALLRALAPSRPPRPRSLLPSGAQATSCSG